MVATPATHTMTLAKRTAFAFVATALLAASSAVAGCSDQAPTVAASGDKLTPGVTYSADLDGDRPPEQIVIDAATGSLTITDGGVLYRSRERWHVVEASLGDTDRDGLLEVVTLLDDEEGRHLGLFAYFGGEYRERLVTSELTPRPLSLRVDGDGTVTGDLVILTVEPAPGQTEPQTIVCRWNGFGFTVIEPPASP